MIDRVTPIRLDVTKAQDVAAVCGDVQIITLARPDCPIRWSSLGPFPLRC
jgi:hypothetical protein